MRKNGIKILKHIWATIPNVESEYIDISQKELLEKYLELFHVGDFFYVIFNTKTLQMEYVSPNIVQVLGYNTNEFDLQFVLNNIHEEDLPYYYHYEKKAVDFFSSLAPHLLLKYKFTYDYRLKVKDGTYKRIQQQIIPIYYFPEGGVRTLGIFTDLSHFKIHGIPKLSFIGLQGEKSYYNIHLEDDFKLVQSIFSKKEQEILNHMIQGMTSENIAKKLNRSIYTIRNHRKSILKKSSCRNLQELFIKATREGWI